MSGVGIFTEAPAVGPGMERDGAVNGENIQLDERRGSALSGHCPPPQDRRPALFQQYTPGLAECGKDEGFNRGPGRSRVGRTTENRGGRLTAPNRSDVITTARTHSWTRPTDPGVTP